MAEQKPGALGNVVGTLVKKEVIPTKKDPKKSWIKFELQSGKSKIRGKSFSQQVVNIIDSFMEGEEVGIWGKLESSEYNEKVYTDFTALKVHDDVSGAETAFRIQGKVLDFFEDEYFFALIVDVTDDPKYGEKFVKLEVPKKSGMAFTTDDIVDLNVKPQGQYGNWTVMGAANIAPKKTFVKKVQKELAATPAPTKSDADPEPMF